MPGTKVSIRPFDYTEADYAALFNIDSAVFPDHPMSVEEWKHTDESRDPDKLFHRDMILLQGNIVAIGEYREGSDPQEYFFYTSVHPDREHPDIRPAYLREVISAIARRNPTAILTGALEDHTLDVDFFQANGFEAVMREPSSELEVATFDVKRFRGTLERVQAEDVEILTLRVLARQDDGWEQKVHQLYELIREDLPSAEPYVERPFAEFKQTVLSAPIFDSDCWFVALDGTSYVGMSMAWRNQVESDRADSGLTGVVRSHRRRGIATALKVHVIERVRHMGISTIVTFNEEGNPMYDLNLSLGFVPKPAWVVYKKVLEKQK